MKKTLVALSLSAALGSAALAAPEAYVIDGNHTFPRFEYSHLGYSIQQSRFDKTTGRVVLDRTAHTGSVEVQIDMKSVNTGSTLFNTHIQGEGYLDTDNFPTASYKSTAVKFDGDKPATVEGNLTIRGISKPVTLTVTGFHCMPHPMLKKDACGANATAKIKRSDFGAGKNVPYVGDEVTLTIAIEAVKE